jgi:hypothetical protein
MSDRVSFPQRSQLHRTVNAVAVILEDLEPRSAAYYFHVVPAPAQHSALAFDYDSYQRRLNSNTGSKGDSVAYDPPTAQSM